MKYVISVGGGLASTMELPERVIAQHGKDNVDLIMCRLPNEDPDVWRLVAAVEKRLDVSVKMIGLGLTPWDIFFRDRFLGNSGVDPCSRALKRGYLMSYMPQHYDPTDTVLCVGITAHEHERINAIFDNWKHKGWQIEAPLIKDETLTREALMAKCQVQFGFVPRLYLMGMSHNNCGGACIKAGHAQWARLLWYLPDVYRWWETNENKFRAEIGEYTILTEGKPKQPLTLEGFRRRLQVRWANMLPGIDPFDGLQETLPCMWCEAA